MTGHIRARSVRAWSRLKGAGEKGSVSAELAVATPLLLLMLLAIVQFALWSHATHIAQAAAAQGLSALRAEDGTRASGCSTAGSVLDQLTATGRGPLLVTAVSCTRTADTASVEIDGRAAPVVPLVSLPVHATATGPVERFVPDLNTGPP